MNITHKARRCARLEGTNIFTILHFAAVFLVQYNIVSKAKTIGYLDFI